MTADEYDLLLANMVARKVLTLEEARQLRADFDGDYAPIPEPEKENDGALLLLLLLLLLGRKRVPARLSARDRDRLRNQLRADFDERMTALATGTGNITGWYVAMHDAINEYMGRMYTAGMGRALTPAEIARLTQEMAVQRGYLQRFAHELRLRERIGRPYSEAYIASRARSYGGEGWGLWFAGNEGGDPNAGERGWVSRWISRDDPATCSPCASLHGTYTLVGAPPFPGTVCYGGGLCRCVKVVEYNLAEYLRLGGR